jgi:tetratricopeptide (TPR) repeat protein
MYNHASEAVKLFPNQSFIYFFKGFGAFQLKKYNEAVDALSFGVKLITEKDDTYRDFLTFLGEAYYQTGEKEKAYKTFDKLLKIDSENIMVLNNYAYYLSLDNKNLEKAAQMSKKTIEKEPENSKYLDTYAWIVYKQKKYSEALIYIEKAIVTGENISDVVLEHYGDILYKNKDVNKALIQWKKAKVKGEGSGNLDKKINDKGFTD